MTQFEQLSLSDTLSNFQYCSLDSDGKVYCKIDWLTAVFFDCSMNDVLRWIRHDACVSDFCAGAYEQSRGYDQVFKFIYNGILLETSSFNFYGQQFDVGLFDVIVPKIRLDLSGSALDYLRSCGVDMDSHRFVVPKLPDGGSYHFTRCDFAFDFINYMPGFVDQLIRHIDVHALPSGRVPLASTNGAIGCRVVTCNQKTVYLGSPQSDRMLRVYDKRMEQSDLQTGVYRRPNPYNDPDSWFRIEWQTRNRYCNDLVQDHNLTFKHILKLIFERYAFADGTFDNRHGSQRPVVDFWLKLFNWKDLETRIIQNAKYVEYESPKTKLINQFEKVMIRTFMFYITTVGFNGLIDACNRYLDDLYRSDPTAQRRYVAFLNRFNQLDILLPRLSDLSSDNPVSLIQDLGRFRFACMEGFVA